MSDESPVVPVIATGSSLPEYGRLCAEADACVTAEAI